MAAQNLVREGLRCRVGNGASIRVWEDRWLPISSAHKVVPPTLFLHFDTKVNELIDTATVSWKSTIIDALFLPHEAKIVKSIPLSSQLPANKLIWTETPNGLFSVCSAYKLAVKLSHPANRGDSSDNSHIRRF
ncbi:uncharacterized protein LOC142625078 [Castanea sativa]|uniref:uncharacterized protein LOC142625078 n=1 Tax=Castanea sativa TaxID=21020 RepID=UPI003F6518BA